MTSVFAFALMLPRELTTWLSEVDSPLKELEVETPFRSQLLQKALQSSSDQWPESVDRDVKGLVVI